MPRHKADRANGPEQDTPDTPDTTPEPAEDDTPEDTTEGNQSAVAGRVNPEA